MLLWTDSAWAACGVSATDGVLVALSGGADSVALLLELLKLQRNGCIRRVEAAHLHHSIRENEADEDAAFVRSLCDRLRVPLVSERIDVPKIARESCVSLELAARNARYAFLERVRTDRDLDCIAIGHHRDDQAETLLLHLLRGSGTDGLAGMRPRSGRLIRPLLFTDKAEILAYLAEKKQAYCTDQTNFLPDATRNRIRLEVLPVLETVNPNVKRALSDAATHIAEDSDFLNELAAEAAAACGTNREKLKALPAPVRTRVLRDLLPYADFTAADLNRLDALLAGQTGDQATLKNGVTAWLDATDLRIGVEESEPFLIPLPTEGSVLLPNGTLSIERVGSALLPCGGFDAYVDADRIRGGMIARSIRKGDRFTPLGLFGSKLLSDYLTDRKVPRFERTTPVVCDEAGILFVVGHTIDERMRVRADSNHILHFHFEED